MVKRKKVNSIFLVRKIFLSHSSAQKGSSVPQQSKLLFHYSPPRGIFPFTPKSKLFYSLFQVHGGRLLGLFLLYRKITKISPGAYIFQRPFLKGLYTEGLMYRGNLRFKIDWACLMVRIKFTVLLCFTLYLGAIFQVEAPGRGLYMEGLIFGILRYLSKLRALGHRQRP